MTASTLPVFFEHAPGQWQVKTAIGDADSQNIEPVANCRAVENQHHARVAHVRQDGQRGCLITGPDGPLPVHQQTAETLDTAIFTTPDEQVIGDTC